MISKTFDYKFNINFHYDFFPKFFFIRILKVTYKVEKIIIGTKVNFIFESISPWINLNIVSDIIISITPTKNIINLNRLYSLFSLVRIIENKERIINTGIYNGTMNLL